MSNGASSEGVAEADQHSASVGRTAFSTETAHQTPEPRPYATYKEYLDRNVGDWPELRWMQHFMSCPSGDPNDTRLTIIDTEDGVLHPRHVALTQSLDLANVLGSRPAEVNTRIIIVAYRESYSVDREVVDVLGRLFDIDPLVLERHFEYDSLYYEDSARASKNIEDFERSKSERLALLPSEEEGGHRCLHIGLDDTHFASAMFLKESLDGREDTHGTVLIWIRSWHPKPLSRSPPSYSCLTKRPTPRTRDIGASIIAILLKWTPKTLRMADRELSDYVAPVLTIMLKRQQHEFVNELDPFIDRYSDFDYEQILFEVRQRLKFLKTCGVRCKRLLRIAGPIETGSLKHNSPLETAMQDLEVLVSELKEAEKTYEVTRRDELLGAQLSEAKKSTTTAISVVQLTKLAFIFIPLNFVTSFFGMNVKSFGNGDVEIWIVFVSGIVLTCLTLCPFIGRVISFDITASVIKLFFISPRIGLWLFAFVLLHSNKTNTDFCSQKVFFYASRGVRHKIQRPRYDEIFWRSKFKWEQPGFWQRFWLQRVMIISKFIDTQLESSSFYQPNCADKLLKWYKWSK